MSGEGKVSIIKKTELPEAVISLRSDGIMHVHYRKNATLDVELQQKMRRIFEEMTEGKKAKFIFSADEGFSLSKEARNQVNNFRNESPVLCYAIVADNLAYKLVANFYIRVSKPEGNYRVFSSFAEAEQWLLSNEFPH